MIQTGCSYRLSSQGISRLRDWFDFMKISSTVDERTVVAVTGPERPCNCGSRNGVHAEHCACLTRQMHTGKETVYLYKTDLNEHTCKPPTKGPLRLVSSSPA